MRRYAAWAGNPRGVAEDPECCVRSVWRPRDWHAFQCNRKRGHGPGGLYCKQHAAMIADGRIRIDLDEAE